MEVITKIHERISVRITRQKIKNQTAFFNILEISATYIATKFFSVI